MKKALLFLSALLISAALWAQVPQGFGYQAVVRDAQGNVVAHQEVGVRLSIVQLGDNEMDVRYAERHTATTNTAGLMTLTVGEGMPITEGTLADIDWAGGPWYLYTEVDPAGGENYSLITIQQLLSVPYALYAANGVSSEQMEYITSLVDGLGEKWALLLLLVEGKADKAELTALQNVVDSLASLPSESCCDIVAAMADEMAGKADKSELYDLRNAVDSLASIPTESCCDEVNTLTSRVDSLEAAMKEMKGWVLAMIDSTVTEREVHDTVFICVTTTLRDSVVVDIIYDTIAIIDTTDGKPKPPVPINDTTRWVDLGLPSGTLWARYNLGTTVPTELGDHYAWGETTPKSEFTKDNYKFENGGTIDGFNHLTKYVTNTNDGYLGFYDMKHQLEPEDDAATANWGGGARIPTSDEWKELRIYCSMTMTMMNGVRGVYVTSTVNGRSIFIPNGAYKDGNYVGGNDDSYWASDLTLGPLYDKYISESASSFVVTDAVMANVSDTRWNGLMIRPVRSKTEEDESDTIAYDDRKRWVDLALPSGTKWAKYDVGSTIAEQTGTKFAWGETTPKSTYGWSNYAHGTSEKSLTKYCDNEEYGHDGFTDGLTEIEATDDAATANWGDGARTPTHEEMIELWENTSSTWTIYNGVFGMIITSDINHRSIFLPINGYYKGVFWSATTKESNPSEAYHFEISYGYKHYANSSSREEGHPIRAVKD